MPDPAPLQEQPLEVPRPPQDASVQNIVASTALATPAQDTPDQLEVMHLSSLLPTLLFVHLRVYLTSVTLVVLYSVRCSLIGFGILQVIHSILSVYYVTLAGFTPFPVYFSFGLFLHFLCYRVLPFSLAYFPA